MSGRRCPCPDTGLWQCECEDEVENVTIHNTVRIPMTTNTGNNSQQRMGGWGLFKTPATYVTAYHPETGTYFAGTDEELKDFLNGTQGAFLPLLVVGLFIIFTS